MKLYSLDTILREHPTFQDFDEETIQLLAGCARNEQYEAGSLIYREGDPADRTFLIRRGDVAIEVSAPGRPAIVIETLHTGDMLGWGWMVAPHVSLADARARTAVSAVSLDAACMRRKCEDNPALGYAMFRSWMPHVTRRMQAMRMQLLDLYGPQTEPANA